MNALTTTTRSRPDGAVLTVTGDLDFASAPLLREAAESVPLGPGQCLELDLSGMTFCDSGGLTALVAARHHAAGAGAGIVLAGVPESTMRILRVVGLAPLFQLRSSA